MTQPRPSPAPSLALAAAVCLMSGISSVCAMPPMSAAAHGARITISHRTTWITTPLDRYGLPDYLAALNREFARGISEKENAAIPLMQLLLTARHLNTSERDWTLDELKLLHAKPHLRYLEPFAGVDNYVYRHFTKSRCSKATLKAMLRGSSQWDWLHIQHRAKITAQDLRWAVAQEEISYALKHPWTAKTCPLVAHYVNRRPEDLELVLAASKLRQIYYPLVPTHLLGSFARVDSIFDPMAFYFRQCEELCVLKANFCLGKGDVKGCLRYLSATRRLINISSLLPEGINRVMAEGSITILLRPSERALLRYPGLSSGDAQNCLRALHNTPLRLPYSSLQQDCLRFTWLDYMITFYRRAEHIGPRPHYSHRHPVHLGDPFRPLLMHPPRGINWNWQFRQINTLISLYLFAENWKASPFDVTHHSPLYTFAARLKHLETERPNPATAPNPNKAFRDDLVSSIFPAMGANVFTILRRIEYCKEADRLDDIAFALAAYRAANGKYPDQLSALCPKYLRHVPENLLAPGPPEYQHGTADYTLIANEPHSKKRDPKQYWRMLRNNGLVLQSPPQNPLVLHRKVVFP